HSVIADSSLEWAAAGRSSLIPHWNRLPLCLFGISLEISHLRAPIRSLDRRILSGLNTRYFLPSGSSRSIQSLLLSSAISRISSMRSSICICLASVYDLANPSCSSNQTKIVDLAAMFVHAPTYPSRSLEGVP